MPTPATSGPRAHSTPLPSTAPTSRSVSARAGDAYDPLLVSVRSGAPFSMPGMMDTVLNLGLNDDSVQGLIEQTQNPRFAWDSSPPLYPDVFQRRHGRRCRPVRERSTPGAPGRGVRVDTELSAEDLQELVAETFKEIFSENVDAEAYPQLVVDGEVAFPQDPEVQLQLAIEAVFGSWEQSACGALPQADKIADDLGTAVNVQCHGVRQQGRDLRHRRCLHPQPRQRRREFYGDYLVNAQGEDVVAGIRNTSPIADLKMSRAWRRPARSSRRVRRARESLSRYVRYRVHHRAR